MYAELLSLSNFSFLRAASHSHELIRRADELGYAALALTDACSVAGVVRAHQAAKARDIRLIVGSSFVLEDGLRLVLLARNRAGYAQLCRLITQARRQADKGAYRLSRTDLETLAKTGLTDCLALLLPQHEEQVAWFAEHFRGRGWLGLALLREGDDEARLNGHLRWASAYDLPLSAVGDVRMHARGRRALLDVLSAIDRKCQVAELGAAIAANGERHLRPASELRELYPATLLRESLRIAALCRFSLDEIAYQYPDDVTPAGSTPRAYLRELTEQGIRRRWPAGCPAPVRAQIEHELQLIAELAYEPYFLTVWDIVRFARQRDILCQGRGSAANSAVCYTLGITEVDPARMNLLFERFLSRERGEPPDIDVDFEHQRREEVIQYIYARYGRQRAALAACVITYRTRSALRDVARALGFTLQQVEALVASAAAWRRGGEVGETHLREAGFDPHSPRVRQLQVLVNQLRGFPRHLSQHVGGFVIARERLDELVPIENAALAERTVIQWDKDDLKALGLLKVDVLALGMLSAIQRSLKLINDWHPAAGLTLADIPAEDPDTYAMIRRADTMGVFQIESRAQMSMLPRLRPDSFYDLVVEVAIVRPGPIQGDMVHPYLRRRQGQEPVDYPSKETREVLERTLGVPIFQEQVIKLAMVAAGFSPGEADQLRRAMAAWRRHGGLEPYRERLMRGMLERGYSAEFADRIYRQILGFGDYGFPESHAASFALLAYASAWLKRHHPAAFCAALINSQPMGFYSPAQLVRDAREHGVQVLPVDVRYSEWDCSLERGDSEAPLLRLGLRRVAGLSQAAAQRLVRWRAARAPDQHWDLAALAQSGLTRDELKCLAAADALAGVAGHRHQAAWAVAGVEGQLPLFGQPGFAEPQPQLAAPSTGQAVLADYRHTGLSLRAHPLALLREQLAARGLLSAQQVADRAPGSMVRAAGLVLIRQRPGGGKAVFVTLEDETGSLNLLVWADLAERQRRVLLGAGLLGVVAEVQRAEGVQHLICRQLEDHSDLLGELQVRSRDFK